MSFQQYNTLTKLEVAPGGFIGVFSSDTGKTHDFTVSFHDLDLSSADRWQLCLTKLDTWFSFYNIQDSTGYDNNSIRYYNGAAWKVIQVTPGNYTFPELIDEIYAQQAVEGDNAAVAGVRPLEFILNYNTGHVELQFNGGSGYRVDFSYKNIYSIFGALQLTYDTSGALENVAKISNNVNQILLHCDLLDGGFINGSVGQVLYTFVPEHPPGAHILEVPNFPNYSLVRDMKHINSVRVRLTDQLGRPIDLNGEPLSIQVHFQPLRSRDGH
jgi:hypothetical protein